MINKCITQDKIIQSDEFTQQTSYFINKRNALVKAFLTWYVEEKIVISDKSKDNYDYLLFLLFLRSVQQCFSLIGVLINDYSRFYSFGLKWSSDIFRKRKESRTQFKYKSYPCPEYQSIMIIGLTYLDSGFSLCKRT